MFQLHLTFAIGGNKDDLSPKLSSKQFSLLWKWASSLMSSVSFKAHSAKLPSSVSTPCSAPCNGSNDLCKLEFLWGRDLLHLLPIVLNESSLSFPPDLISWWVCHKLTRDSSSTGISWVKHEIPWQWHWNAKKNNKVGSFPLNKIIIE